ncbi:ATPase, delta subunit (H(+)-transporting two-sector ATPase) [Flavobacterium saliperosum S13]|uniref:ATP synthase subunit delta n=2 Tax=Flavobacterium saliperosum TaxID=329186 RepID=A0A1G4W3L0_9FLAO|nr:ATP synthase F1 subunit delta [Flavobacterium saliperosum]ESU26160.1 ATPase, delta subunit (H(+)-transporting two-sector ATPase) [Flavobacterium saliperosum S13]SCX16214.1 ATP synthase F1 subcomplex delta subunit [Flavobacterium saliperosum]
MSRAAIRYAKAILDIANSNGKATNVNEDMKSIVTAVVESAELKEFLSNPTVKGDVKVAALSEVFASVQNETKSLFRLLLENKRFEILPAVASQYNLLFDELNGVEVAKVTTAFPITPELEAKVLAKIKEFSNKSVTINNIVDESIIGGFILRIGDKQYNASVANSLQTLKRELLN